MRIYIPTRGRSHNQKTWESLPSCLQDIVSLVVDNNEVSDYRNKWPKARIMALPKNLKGIAYIRQYILEHSDDRHVVMLDDDLKFYVKTKEKKIIEATEEQIINTFVRLDDWLSSGIVHCGVTPRFLNWQSSESYRDNTRLMHVLAYDTKIVNKSGCKFTNNVPTHFSMDDFHMTLQLLRAGYANRLDLKSCIGVRFSNSVGGARIWRTLETHNASAHLLKKLHSNFVTVRHKKVSDLNWRKMKDGKMYDVIVQWRKAFSQQ